jgi:hypothetical protein
MRRQFTTLCCVVFLWACGDEQVVDHAANVSVAAPTFETATAPRIAVDSGHHNFHTIEGRYAPFAQLLRNDGARVTDHGGEITDASLAQVDVLVIANSEAPPASAGGSAFTSNEIAAIRGFVEGGGGLLLIADHAPFAGDAAALAAAFRIQFEDIYVDDGNDGLFTLGNGGLVRDPALGDVTHVRTFTGSAFRAEGEVRPLLRLGSRATLQSFIEGDPPRLSEKSSAEGRLQGALIEVGAGRVAVFGEAAMFSAQRQGFWRSPMGFNARGAEQNKQLLLNVVHWLAKGD